MKKWLVLMVIGSAITIGVTLWTVDTLKAQQFISKEAAIRIVKSTYLPYPYVEDSSFIALFGFLKYNGSEAIIYSANPDNKTITSEWYRFSGKYLLEVKDRFVWHVIHSDSPKCTDMYLVDAETGDIIAVENSPCQFG